MFHSDFELVKLPARRVRIVGALEAKIPGLVEHKAHAAQSTREPGTDGLEIGLFQSPQLHEASRLSL